MGEEDGCLCRVQGIVHCLRTDVREINCHAEAVHFENHMAPCSGEAVVQGLGRGGTVCVFIVAEVGEGCVARAEGVVEAEGGCGRADLVEALDAEEGGDSGC